MRLSRERTQNWQLYSLGSLFCLHRWAHLSLILMEDRAHGLLHTDVYCSLGSLVLKMPG